ncbi:uncharacterized protein [Euwallacea fornicatus]
MIILVLSGHCSSHRPRQFLHTLNNVSNFDGIFGKKYRDIPKQSYSEENYLSKNASNKNYPLEDNIGIENVNLSVKHDLEKEQRPPGFRKVGKSEERDELKPHIIRVVSPLSRQEKCNTSNSKNCFNDLPSYLVKIDKGGQKNRKIPEYNDDYSKTPAHRSCKNYGRVDALCPVLLLASMLMTKLMQPKNGSKLEALKCSLDNPKIQQYRKSYLQRKKRQLEYLKGRGSKRKKLKINRKNRRDYRNINATEHMQITNMAKHTSRNWTSNKTLISTPLYFGTISPVERRPVATNIKDIIFSEEKSLLKKISSCNPGNRITASEPFPLNVQFSRTEVLPNGTYPRSLSNGTLSSLDQSYQEIRTNTQPPDMTPSVQQDPQKLKTDFNSKINDPKFRKILVEIMQRQQKMTRFENLLQATTKTYIPSDANQRMPPVPTANTTSLAPNSPAPPDEKTTSDIANTGNSSYTKSNFWGLIVPSPTYEAEIKMNKSSKRSEKPEEITESLYDVGADSIKVGVSAKNDIQSVAPQLSTTYNLPNSSIFVSDRNHVTQIELSPEMKKKLNKLQKDLKMVQEIQSIFNEVAGMRKQQFKKKSSNGSNNKGNKKKQSGPEDNVKQYDDVISAIIKTRIWNETKNKGLSSSKTIKRKNREVPSSAKHFFGTSYQNLQ